MFKEFVVSYITSRDDTLVSIYIRVVLTKEFLFDFNVEREGGATMKLFSFFKKIICQVT